MNEEEIVKKLINTYPNSISVTIEYNRWPKLDFVETVDNFAENIMNDFEPENFVCQVFEALPAAAFIFMLPVTVKVFSKVPPVTVCATPFIVTSVTWY